MSSKLATSSSHKDSNFANSEIFLQTESSSFKIAFQISRISCENSEIDDSKRTSVFILNNTK